jgi:hypothetical protein
MIPNFVPRPALYYTQTHHQTGLNGKIMPPPNTFPAWNKQVPLDKQIMYTLVHRAVSKVGFTGLISAFISFRF